MRQTTRSFDKSRKQGMIRFISVNECIERITKKKPANDAILKKLLQHQLSAVTINLLL